MVYFMQKKIGAFKGGQTLYRKKTKKKMLWQQWLAMGFYILMGAVCGLMMVWYIDSTAEITRSMGEKLLILVGLFVGMYVAIFLHIIVHEAGHLLFGLMTGYRFSSFRVGSLMWVKENGKLQFRKLTVAGTGGQCLMDPPDMVDGKVPLVLYNLGGSIVNVVLGLLFLVIFLFLGQKSLAGTICLMIALIGFISAIMNGVPMRLGMVDNDGYNAFSLRKNKAALRGLWVQLKVNGQVAKGVRLKDMPEEWFVLPEKEEWNNSMTVTLAVFAANRWMDMRDFNRAAELMEELLLADTGIVDLHRNLLLEDLIYCELMREMREDKLGEMLDEELEKFRKTMKNFPTVLRTRYAYALLVEKDSVKAEQIRSQFEKISKTYPYPNEIVAERELMDMAKEKVQIQEVEENAK